MAQASSNGDLVVSIRREPDALDLPLPAYATAEAAGMDLCAALTHDAVLKPGARLLVDTGIRIALPFGYEAQVRPRSGLAVRAGLTVLNSPGTVDSDYRGVIKVPLINLGQEDVVLKRGDRIAQMVVAPVTRVQWAVAEELTETERQEGGFGHTGLGRTGDSIDAGDGF
ncbi:deoxyuridine 5'-triphosphate nucleotidohydrolase [Capsulimonas corticalis]|uniref:Deoxyuridine 5'-triphosphate nucleotidohydrolase n=1 Tax=Capsulimonas corticalis TaxID=2219043 RepID=A0A402CXB8_9BACT|nr:dUTP diphosphatase [Capsulimonas corticalis]BDI32371.1 deoxyuridine 5'-triphosphate nucleotidohydrolase [Capsulimonas corticalis]